MSDLIKIDKSALLPETLISQAIDKGVSVETMEKLLSMRRELKAEHAREMFDRGMAKFQSDCPQIEKTKAVPTKSGKIAYRYAPLDSIILQVKGLLQKHGFSFAIQTETKPDSVKVSCVAKHEFGHSETANIEVPLGNKTEIMSQTQVVAAALTFAKRYAFCNAFGIVCCDEDNDAQPKTEGESASCPDFEPLGKPDSPSAPLLSVAEILEKIKDAKALPHLKNIWTKHYDEIKKFSEGEQEILLEWKDKMKEILNSNLKGD